MASAALLFRRRRGSTPYVAGFGEYQMSQVTSTAASLTEKGEIQ